MQYDDEDEEEYYPEREPDHWWDPQVWLEYIMAVPFYIALKLDDWDNIPWPPWDTSEREDDSDAPE